MAEQSERMAEDMSLELLASFLDVDTENIYGNLQHNFCRKRLRFSDFVPPISATILTADRAVQTEPELNDISPSWMIATESQLCKLHTKVRNMVNTLHDTPDGYFRKEIKTTYDRYFTFVDGYWQSVSRPEVKFPATGTNLAMLMLELKDVMKITSRLRDDFPYIAEPQRGSSPVVDASGSNSQKVYADVEKTAGWCNVKPCAVDCNPRSHQSDAGMVSCSKHTETDFHGKRLFCSFQSIPSTCENCNTKKEYSCWPIRRALGELNEAASLFPTGNSKCLKGSLTKITRKYPSDDIAGNREIQASTKVRPGNHKDFIKRNILAVKSSVVSRKRIR